MARVIRPRWTSIARAFWGICTTWKWQLALAIGSARPQVTAAARGPWRGDKYIVGVTLKWIEPWGISKSIMLAAWAPGTLKI